MKPMQIEGMIDRIVGIFPAHNVSRNAMKSTWSQDDYLLDVDVNLARQVIPLVEAHGRIPSLPEIKQMFRQLMQTHRVSEEAVTCAVCDSTGWDNGRRIERTANGSYEITHEFATETHLGNTYTVVRPCFCPIGAVRRGRLSEMSRS